MLKQLSIATASVAALGGIAYLAYKCLTGKDEADSPEAEESGTEAKDEESEAKDEESEAQPKGTDPREELRDALRTIANVNVIAQDEAKRFTESADRDFADSEIVTGLVRLAMIKLDGGVKQFLEGCYEYPFDELSDEEVLDVLAEARRQMENMNVVLKELRSVQDAFSADNAKAGDADSSTGEAA